MRKKSAKKAAEWFVERVDEIETFLEQDNFSGLSEKHVTWVYDYAIIRLYREFEDLMLSCLVAAINNDPGEFSDKTGVSFPKHLNQGVCEYLIVGDGYFDFGGKSGLVNTLKTYLPNTHYLVVEVRKQTYHRALESLFALRNFAAHDSWKSKKKALDVLGLVKMGSAGAWLKNQGRFKKITISLKTLANEININSPY